MKKLLLIFLPAIFSFSIYAQNAEEPLDVQIKTPRMSELINKLWADLPTNCTIPPVSAIIEGEDKFCATMAMKHLRHVINLCTISDGFKDAIKMEFKIIKLIPVGRVAGLMLDVADLTVKALTANSPEELESDLTQFGFGRIVGPGSNR